MRELHTFKAVSVIKNVTPPMNDSEQESSKLQVLLFEVNRAKVKNNGADEINVIIDGIDLTFNATIDVTFKGKPVTVYYEKQSRLNADHQNSNGDYIGVRGFIITDDNADQHQVAGFVMLASDDPKFTAQEVAERMRSSQIEPSLLPILN